MNPEYMTECLNSAWNSFNDQLVQLGSSYRRKVLLPFCKKNQYLFKVHSNQLFSKVDGGDCFEKVSTDFYAVWGVLNDSVVGPVQPFHKYISPITERDLNETLQDKIVKSLQVSQLKELANDYMEEVLLPFCQKRKVNFISGNDFRICFPNGESLAGNDPEVSQILKDLGTQVLDKKFLFGEFFQTISGEDY
jgi:hypothetical protein